MILFTVDKVFTRYLLIKRRRLDEVEYPILNKTTTLVHVIFLNVNYLPLEKSIIWGKGGTNNDKKLI